MLFQGTTTSDGRTPITLSNVGVTFWRGAPFAYDAGWVVEADVGQSRVYHSGLAFSSASSALLYVTGTTPSFFIGGLGVTGQGAVCIVDEPPDVYVAGVGLKNDGRLCTRFTAPPSASFDFYSGSVLSSGQYPLSFFRSSVAWTVDFEQAIRACLTGELRERGKRRVRSLVSGSSETMTGGFWTQFTSGDGVIGSIAGGISCTVTTASRAFKTIGVDVVAGNKYRISFTVASATTRPWTSTFTDSAALGTFDYSGNISTSGRVSTLFTCTSSGNSLFRIGVGVLADESNQLLAFSYILIEDVTGQSNQNPSEYVSTGVLSTPFHGAFVDGVKNFPTENGNTVASNIVVEATGSIIPIRTVNRGVWQEAPSSNLVLHSNNLADVSWVKVGVVITSAAKRCGDITLDLADDTDIVDLGQVNRPVTFSGIDGDKVYSAVISESSAVLSSLGVRDDTLGVFRGLVNITWSAGVPIATPQFGILERAPEQLADGCWRIFLAMQGVVVLNAHTVRIYPAGAGSAGSTVGAIYLGCCQVENVRFSSSVIVTGAVTGDRLLETLKLPIGPYYNMSEGSFWAECSLYTGPSASNNSIISSQGADAGNRVQLIINSGGNARMFMATLNVTQADVTTGPTVIPGGTPVRMACRYKLNDCVVANQGNLSVTDVTCTPPTVIDIVLGSGTAIGALNGFLGEVKIYTTGLPDSTLAFLTLPS